MEKFPNSKEATLSEILSQESFTLLTRLSKTSETELMKIKDISEYFSNLPIYQLEDIVFDLANLLPKDKNEIYELYNMTFAALLRRATGLSPFLPSSQYHADKTRLKIILSEAKQYAETLTKEDGKRNRMLNTIEDVSSELRRLNVEA